MDADYAPIFFAAANGHLDQIRELAPHSSKTDLNQALAEAASLSQLEAADLLLEFGAEPNGLYHADYGTVLFPACERLNPEGIRFLLKQGADPKQTVLRFDGPRDALTHLFHTPFRSPLKAACVDLLLRAGAAPAVDPAVLAIHRESPEALREALDADPEALRRPIPDDYGLHPLQQASLLHLAVEFNQPALALELLDRGLDVNQPAGEIPGTVKTAPVWPTRLVPLGGQTPLFHARGHSKEMLRFLLDRGADPACTARFLRKGRTVRLTAQEFFQAIDDIECNLLEELLILRGV